ncbi:hypothetical protein GCM10008014_00270 [Paenibacillus silvae]|uniref:Uncharacterized protein n=1 Tax=Paenibacillus silvae TaxID=1325358 RepID=A0ABQ1YXS6_9BACL|nr:hypothetical protein [Paenibacillus silvae]GGH41002.1 hypothetical protein GCM10008014_00270 [Paenibacillus silvae]
MKIKSLIAAALLGSSMVFGSASANAAPVDTNLVSPFAAQKLVLQVGDVHYFYGAISDVDNLQNVIKVSYTSGLIEAIKPGEANLRVFRNGVYTVYNIVVIRK